ncbi:Glycerol-3-phosphate/dihydroxyacetone phosphate acyltransferase [Oleoguttula sp. CCFEE 5521]
MAPPSKSQQRTNAITYDSFLWLWTVIIDLFFREIHPRSTWRIPRTGPVIFVAAPHANQFVDPLILMRVVRADAKRRIAILIAAKSMKRKFIGWAAGLMQSVPVGRALDDKKPAEGRIWLPDAEGEPYKILGEGVDFTNGDFVQGGLLVLPSVNNVAANAEIAEVVSETEIRLKKAFKGDVAMMQLSAGDSGHEVNGMTNGDSKEKPPRGTKFQVAPHIDQGAVYDAVFQRLHEGGCIGIFPEGGSHDRTELLPLKPGLAIMALGALEKDPDCGVTIVPVGMNYFHAHKFRSRCVIEFGPPIPIAPELVGQYRSGNKRDPVGKVLEEVTDALKAVTLQAPDYETLMLVQTVRRLYNPQGKRLPLPMIIELQRRFLRGFEKYRDDDRVKKIKKGVMEYHKKLMQLNIRDHQLSYAKYPWWKVIGVFLFRAFKLAGLALASGPGVVLFSPVFVGGKLISIRKAREALAASTVKIQARDVIATWKILVSLALAPTLMIIYTAIGTYWTYRNRVGGRVPEWIPLWFVTIFQAPLYLFACYWALRFGEIGMDIFKSLRPLFLLLFPSSSNTLVRLREQRTALQEQITEIVNELGPELFSDFDQQRILGDPQHTPHSPSRSRPSTPNHTRDGSNDIDALRFTPASPTSPKPLTRKRTDSNELPRNESFGNINSFPIFATRPGTPNRSRSRTNSSDGFKLKGFTALNSGKKKDDDSEKKGLEAVSRELKAAMRERGKRRSKSGWEFERDDGSEGEDEGKKGV